MVLRVVSNKADIMKYNIWNTCIYCFNDTCYMSDFKIIGMSVVLLIEQYIYILEIQSSKECNDEIAI